LIEINNLKIICTAYTALGVKRSLLGREVLKKLKLTYDPPEKLELSL